MGHSERTDAVIEPRLSMQWWCKMDALAAPALDAVMNEEVSFLPPKYKNLYRHWMENIHDWCISRQLWWGQRIPAWYDGDGNIYVAETEEEAVAQAKLQNPASAIQKQDEDVLDTWFSSWLWPLQVFGWNDDPDNAELDYYYPTTTLVTAPEIIFFWVARMIMAGYHFKGQKPFEQVYFTGIVRDKQGRKMSKQLGNSPDLLKLIDDFGADAVRFSVMISSPAGNDLLYDESALEQGRNFSNKLWNALKLVKSWEDRLSDDPVAEMPFALRWFRTRLAEASAEVEGSMKDFRISESLKSIYSLIWDDFCSWYLEWAKPEYGAQMPRVLWEETVALFEELLTLLHPFLPFITEEIYQSLRQRAAGEFLMNRQLGVAFVEDASLLGAGAKLQSVITALRDARSKAGLKPKEAVRISVLGGDAAFYSATDALLRRQSVAESVSIIDTAPEGAIALVVGADRIFVQSDAVALDAGAQQEGLQKELGYLRGFLASVEKKLSNERFVQNAKPEVVNAERKKLEDTLAKIGALEQSLRRS